MQPLAHAGENVIVTQTRVIPLGGTGLARVTLPREPGCYGEELNRGSNAHSSPDPHRGSCGGVPGHVENRWRILPVGEVHAQPAALAGGHRRNGPWRRVSRKPHERRSLSPPSAS